VEAGQADALRQVADVNKSNVELSKALAVKIDQNHELEAKLRDSLATIPDVAKTRIIYREVQRATNPDCRAWLDAPVPCRLHADPAGGDHSPGTRPGGAPRL